MRTPQLDPDDDEGHYPEILIFAVMIILAIVYRALS
jgi:hypothetical protein